MLTALMKDLRTFLALLVLSVGLIFIDSSGALNTVKSPLQYITSPIQYGLYKSSLVISRQFESITVARKASLENKALTEQLAQVLSENAGLRRKVLELEAFSAQQKTLNAQTFNLEASRPVGLGRYLIIDKGSDNNIKVSQPVIFKDNYIGKIKEVSPKKSQVLLSSDPDSHISAFAASESKTKGILSGQFGSELLMDKILHQEGIKKGDLVYTEGLEPEIPRGLILGQVVDVLSKDNEVFKQATVKPIFDVGNLDVVFVVTN